MYPPLQAPKRLLFGPGPSIVAPRVYHAMGQTVVGHLDPFFFQVTEEVRKLRGSVRIQTLPAMPVSEFIAKFKA